MKKINEKSFRLIKICVVLITFLTCGFYYVLFADEFTIDSENVIKENVSNSQVVVKKEENKINYLVNELNSNEGFIKKENDEKIFFVEETKKTEDSIVLKEEDDDLKILENDKVQDNIKKVETVVDGKVNINKANKEELETLKNIGSKVAENIINYRKENGGFFDIEEIKNVKGIGDKKYDTIKDYIFVE